MFNSCAFENKYFQFSFSSFKGLIPFIEMQGRLPPEKCFVERSCEEDIQQVLMHKGQAKHSAAKPEPIRVVLHKGGHGRYLHSVGVVGGVFEQPVVRVEKLARKKEEKLSRRPTVVQALFSVETDVQLGLLQVLFAGSHHLVEGIAQQVVSSDVQPSNKRRH